MSKVPKVHREKTGVEGRGTEVGSESDVCEVGKVYIEPAGWKFRLAHVVVGVPTTELDSPIRGFTLQIKDCIDNTGGHTIDREE